MCTDVPILNCMKLASNALKGSAEVKNYWIKSTILFEFIVQVFRLSPLLIQNSCIQNVFLAYFFFICELIPKMFAQCTRYDNFSTNFW